MKRYDLYKDSGVEWIGEIPKSWEKVSLGKLGVLYGGLTGKSGDDFRSEDHPSNKPFIPFTNIFNNTYISKDHFQNVVVGNDENQNKVEKYDLFFLMSSEDYDDLGKSSILIDNVGEVYLNSFCKGLRVTRGDVYPLFLNYQLLGDTHKKLISIEGNGFTRINLRQDRLKETPVFFPSLYEQQQIVSFLDSKTSQIDELIQKKERKIELLKEYRTSLINEVVTKGLNPNVEMKDSGVEWIGEIPSHWKRNKLIRITDRIGDGLHSTPKYVDSSEYFFINGNNLVNGEIKIFDSTKCVSEEEFKEHFIQLNSKTLLLSINGTIGNLSFYNGEKVILGKSSCYINLKEHINHHFVYYFLKSESISKYFTFELTGTTIFNLSLNSVRNTPIVIPPEIEQQQIVEYLDDQTSKIDNSIQLEEKKIELLKEYRQSLISSVVTGKIDVRTN